MRIAEMNWMQVEQHVMRDRRAVLPLGSTEQHAQLSLCVDAILADRVSIEAAQPLDVRCSINRLQVHSSFVDYAGTVTLRLSTLCALVCVLGLVRSGFGRCGCQWSWRQRAAQGATLEQLLHRGVQVKWHNWYNAP
jgi:creatinine amidohydrolase